jgi:hypothetical protein
MAAANNRHATMTALIASNGKNPSFKRSLCRIKALNVLEGGYQCFLCRIFRQSGFTHNAQGKIE